MNSMPPKLRRSKPVSFLHARLALAALACAAALVAAPAEALGPFYVAGKLGDTSVDAELGESLRKVIDGDDDSWSIALGLRLGRHLAFQIEYHDLGRAPGSGPPCPDGAEVCPEVLVPLAADSTALSLSVLPHLRLTRGLSLYGKLGLVSWDSEIEEILDTGDRFIEEFDDEDLLWGGGLRLGLPGPFGFFAEYERLADQFDTVSLGATLGF